MSFLKDVVVCKFAKCNQVYNDARILPCGKRTCFAHIEEMMITNDDNHSERKMIQCFFCQKTHSFPDDNDEFPVDENIPKLLNIKYSREHSAAKKCFNEVMPLIEKLTKIDQEGFVIDYFERIEADIVLEKDSTLQKLIAYYQKLVAEVHARKVKCLLRLTNKTLEDELNAIKKRMVEHASQLKKQNLDFIIKTLDGDEDKWQEIQAECSSMMANVKSLDKELKMRIMGDLITEFKPLKNEIQVEHICGHLDRRMIYSTILNTQNMMDDLVDLCKLIGKEFKLLYQASRDGFNAASFHAMCDHLPRTLTVIQTTKGFIFGGYTSIEWDGTKSWKADPSAFLFSLVNISQPQLMPVKAGDAHSIYCHPSHGPIFGAGHSIHISNNSNTTTVSYSNLCRQSYDFTLFDDVTNDQLLAGSRNFQTSEIEVYQLN